MKSTIEKILCVFGFAFSVAAFIILVDGAIAYSAVRLSQQQLPDSAYFVVSHEPLAAVVLADLAAAGFGNVETSGTGDYVGSVTVGTTPPTTVAPGATPNPKPKYDSTTLISICLTHR